MRTDEAATLDGQDTLVASWDALARLTPDARLVRTPAAMAAVFPSWAPLNNAILLDEPSSASAAAAAAGLVGLYDDADVPSWALWLPSRAASLDAADPVDTVDGLTRDTTTLVMKLTLGSRHRHHRGVIRTSVAAATRASEEPVAAAVLPSPERIPGLDAWAMVDGDVAVSGAWSFLRGTDCGIYSVGTVEEYRRRGLARALMQHVLAVAQQRGARTATLQATPMGQALYEGLGFEPVGRYDEWVRE